MDKAQRQREIREKLGLYLGRVRDARGLSQQQLGELADLSTNHISKIERGCSSVKFENLLMICIALEISLDDFILNDYLAGQENGEETAVSYRAALEKHRREDEAERLKDAMNQAIDKIYKV